MIQCKVPITEGLNYVASFTLYCIGVCALQFYATAPWVCMYKKKSKTGPATTANRILFNFGYLCWGGGLYGDSCHSTHHAVIIPHVPGTYFALLVPHALKLATTKQLSIDNSPFELPSYQCSREVTVAGFFVFEKSDLCRKNFA